MTISTEVQNSIIAMNEEQLIDYIREDEKLASGLTGRDSCYIPMSKAGGFARQILGTRRTFGIYPPKA